MPLHDTLVDHVSCSVKPADELSIDLLLQPLNLLLRKKGHSLTHFLHVSLLRVPNQFLPILLPLCMHLLGTLHDRVSLLFQGQISRYSLSLAPADLVPVLFDPLCLRSNPVGNEAVLDLPALSGRALGSR